MKKITIIIFLMTLSLCFSAKYAGEFLLINPDVRSIGMGSCGNSFGNNVSSFLNNPANLAKIETKSVSTMYSSMYGDVFSPLAYYHHIGIAFPVMKGGTVLGINWVRFGVDGIPYFPYLDDYARKDSIEAMNGKSSGSFSDSEDAVFVTIAGKFKTNVNLGWDYFSFPLIINSALNIKFINIALDDKSASGIGFDFGTIFEIGFDKYSTFKNLNNLKLGISVSDFNNTGIKWSESAQDAIPLRLKSGISYIFKFDFISSAVAIAYDNIAEFENKYYINNYGFEYSYNDLIFLRCGLNNDILTAGTGLSYAGFGVDYAILNTDLGMVNKLSLSYKFK